MVISDLAQAVLRELEGEVAGEGAREEEEVVCEVREGRIHRGFPAGHE